MYAMVFSAIPQPLRGMPNVFNGIFSNDRPDSGFLVYIYGEYEAFNPNQ
jgi:hypothetical protein